MTISNQANLEHLEKLELYTTESRNWFDDYFESSKFGAFRNKLELYTTESRNWFDDYFESSKFGAFRNQLELYTTESRN